LVTGWGQSSGFSICSHVVLVRFLNNLACAPLTPRENAPFPHWVNFMASLSSHACTYPPPGQGVSQERGGGTMIPVSWHIPCTGAQPPLREAVVAPPPSHGVWLPVRTVLAQAGGRPRPPRGVPPHPPPGPPTPGGGGIGVTCVLHVPTPSRPLDLSTVFFAKFVHPEPSTGNFASTTAKGFF